MFTEFRSYIPVEIVGSHGWKGPTGKAAAIGIIDRGIDHHLIWVCFLDSDRSCWSVENIHIRARVNLTWGRNLNFNLSSLHPKD